MNDKDTTSPISTKTDDVPSLRRDMIKGSTWMVAMRWSIRSIGLISTVILARLLAPEDFGLVAMAMLVVGLLDMLVEFGVDIALIQNTEAKRRHFDTAWTIQVIQGIFVAVILIILAPSAAVYFNEPRVVTLMQVISIGVVIQGFSNIGVVAFRKEFNFKREFWFMVSKKLVTFPITIGLAIWLRSYWALVFGMLAGQFFSVALSYFMHSYRPKFSLSAIREIWSFSQWMLIINIGYYASLKIDEFIVGGITNAKSLGLYTVSSEIANLPTTEMLTPIARALFPGYAKLASEPKRFGQAYLNVVGFAATFAVAAGVGIALVAENLTLILLGPKWVDVIPLLQCLAIFGTFKAIYGQAGTVLIALGHVRILAITTWVQLILLVPTLIFAGNSFGLIGIAIAKTSIAAIFMVLIFSILCQSGLVQMTQIIARIWRPFAAGTAMTVIVILFQNSTTDSMFFGLIKDITIGALAYIITLFTMWIISGKPNGTERLILDIALSKIKQLNFNK